MKEACPLISGSKAGPIAGGKGSDVMVEINAVVLGANLKSAGEGGKEMMERKGEG